MVRSNLKSADLSHNYRLTDEGAVALAGTKVREVNFAFCSGITGVSLEALQASKHLKKVDLTYCFGIPFDALKTLDKKRKEGLLCVS